MDEVLVSLINAFAPTVSSKLLDVVSKRKVKRDDLYIVLVALLAEQNHTTAKSLKEMGDQMSRLARVTNEVLREIKTVNEGIAVLLKRTES